MKFNVSSIAVALPLGLSVADDSQNLRHNIVPMVSEATIAKMTLTNVRHRPIPGLEGIKKGSFCVDYDPPQKFKCGCLPDYQAILPNVTDVKDNVTVDWRPKVSAKGCMRRFRMP
jgi:hypothetical protein